MMRWSLAGVWCALIVWLRPRCARRKKRTNRGCGSSRVATSATVRGDCQTCEEDFPYRHGPGILANAGYRVNPRMDVGAEIFWVPLETASGTLNTTHIDAIAQFRPWRTHGFFIKGGAGMGFIRNWVDAIGPGAINSKALSVVIGGRMGVPRREAGRLSAVCEPARRRAWRLADRSGRRS